tara:strand:+ start:257 stop:565 length:309 start_codon:yes stop_codon:yes gene_type:complete
MKRYLALTGAIVGLTALFAGPAQAQMICGPRSDIVEKLTTQYEEHQAAMGLASNGTLFEVFSSKAGSWTIMVSEPGGKTCLVATGEGWQKIDKAAKTAGKTM